ncbi:MAG: S-methyl-5-thioribose-1-phosphate isomerase [Atopobiaceae bacterium]|jgi:methylthioribose-1-phosphate isomerase|nr:S-methyl-5-thioribose-1-phosphate isomerase [Atopobiaceae bacterium]MCI2173622.1 S-methyl-5-thioribose-1-phosphate isomerase [Atopobiaceae bacterium]MCI2207736.1 S-methyl-5-thioribose-1-phosphate isomerase [Atopobiaceae bacterium]
MASDENESGMGPEEVATFLATDTVAIDDETNELVIIDQTRLPNDLVIERLRTREEAWRAIKRLEVRGAPAIGVSAAIAFYLDARAALAGEATGEKGLPLAATTSWDALSRRMDETHAYLDSSRPTAVNLSWALRRMHDLALSRHEAGDDPAAVVEALREEAHAIRDEDVRTCRAIGENGLELVHDGDGLITHCNAGRLATVRYGTATAPMYVGQERGYTFHVTCDETRPLLQGARLTAFELMASDIDAQVECDGMSSSLMRTGAVQAAFVGCDRVAANGDVANKIGTSMLALACARHHVPLYVCAPTSTIDMSCPTGADIPIEQRAAEEVTQMWYTKRMAPAGVGVYNPAFDVTDADLVTAIVTERGVARPPYGDSLARIMAERG